MLASGTMPTFQRFNEVKTSSWLTAQTNAAQ